MPEEIALAQRIANALKGYKGSKAQKYLDALPEMAVSQLTGAASPLPSLVDAYNAEGGVLDKGKAFLGGLDKYTTSPNIDAEVVGDIAGVIPQPVKDASAAYGDWAAENPNAAYLPGLALSAAEQAFRMPKSMNWNQLKGHPKEAEIREKGVWPTGVGGQYLMWSPRYVNRETGMPDSFTISNNPNRDRVNSRRDGYTSATIYGEGNQYGLPPFAKVGGAFNAEDGSGAGAGGHRYNVLIDAMFGNKMGATSSNQNSAFSTASWERELEKQQRQRPDAVGIMAKSHPAQEFVWGSSSDRPTYAGRYMTNTVPNWGLFPREVAGDINSRKYSRASGTARGPNGEQPNFAVMYSQRGPDGKVLKERFGNKTRVPPVYLTTDDAAREGVGRPGYGFTPMSNEDRQAQVRALRDNNPPPAAPEYDFPYAGNPADYTVSPSRVPDDPSAAPNFGSLFGTPAPQISARRQEAAALREAPAVETDPLYSISPEDARSAADRAAVRRGRDNHNFPDYEDGIGRIHRRIGGEDVVLSPDMIENPRATAAAIRQSYAGSGDSMPVNAKLQLAELDRKAVQQEADWAHLTQSPADLPVPEKEVIDIPSEADLAYFDSQAAATPDPIAEVNIPDWTPEPEPVIPSGPTASELQALNRERQAAATALRNRATANRAEINRLEGLDVRNPGWDVFRNMKRDSLQRTGDPQVPEITSRVTNQALPRAMTEARPTNPLMLPENAALVGEGRGVWDREYARSLRPTSNHDAASMSADAAKANFYGMEMRPELRDAFLEMMFRTPRYDRP